MNVATVDCATARIVASAMTQMTQVNRSLSGSFATDASLRLADRSIAQLRRDLTALRIRLCDMEIEIQEKTT